MAGGVPRLRHPSTLWREPHHLGAAIKRVLLKGDKALALKRIERSRHACRVKLKVICQLPLRARTKAMQVGKKLGLARAQADGRHKGMHERTLRMSGPVKQAAIVGEIEVGGGGLSRLR